MWLFVLFDLPTQTKEHRRLHTRFRKRLEKMGFSRAQFSVYINHFASEDASESVQKRIQRMLPEEGNIRLLLVTDRQFSKMQAISSKKRILAEKPLPQVLLF